MSTITNLPYKICYFKPSVNYEGNFFVIFKKESGINVDGTTYDEVIDLTDRLECEEVDLSKYEIFEESESNIFYKLK